MPGPTDSRSHEFTRGESDGPRWAGRSSGRDGGGGEVWSRYHCPVCSHQDRVTLRDGRGHILCSHCETPLEVVLATPWSESASVRVDLDFPLS